LSAIALLLVVFAIVDGCRAVVSYVTLGEAAREAAHVAELEKSTDADVLRAVNAHSGMLGDLSSTATVSPAGSRAPGQTVSVQVRYLYTPVTPLASKVGSVTLSSRTTVVVE
jgi:Flp pilus assembly protein TadG